MGQPEGVLVQQMGVPSRNYETAGVKYLAYDEHRVDLVPSFPSYSPFFTGWYGGGFPPQVIELQCETTFEVADGHREVVHPARQRLRVIFSSVPVWSAGRRTG